MSYVNYRILSLIVAWLHIVGSAITGLFLSYSMIFWSDMNDDDYKERNIYNAVYLSCLILCCILSTFLVKGIKQNRPEFMAAWIYAYYVLFGVLIGWTFYVTIDGQNAGASFSLVALIFAYYLTLLGISILLFFPVYMMYKQLLVLQP